MDVLCGSRGVACMLSYFCNRVAFWSSPRLVYRFVGLVNFDWGRLGFGCRLQAVVQVGFGSFPWVSHPPWTSSYPESALQMSNDRNARQQMETSDNTRVLYPELSHCLPHPQFIFRLQGEALPDATEQEFWVALQRHRCIELYHA